MVRRSPFTAALGVAALAAFAPLAALAGDTACPATVVIDEALRGVAPAGWAAAHNGLPKNLNGITLYDGHPDQAVSLPPTSDRREGAARVAVWKFGAAERPWLACRYLGTGLILVKPLEAGTADCTLRYAAGGVVQSFRCRQRP